MQLPDLCVLSKKKLRNYPSSKFETNTNLISKHYWRCLLLHSNYYVTFPLIFIEIFLEVWSIYAMTVLLCRWQHWDWVATLIVQIKMRYISNRFWKKSERAPHSFALLVSLIPNSNYLGYQRSTELVPYFVSKLYCFWYLILIFTVSQPILIS